MAEVREVAVIHRAVPLVSGRPERCLARNGLLPSKLMRIDKWLWTARLFKTRASATEAVRGGRVHLNGVATKPSREVAEGDELEVTLGPLRRTVVVRGAAERRVSAVEAAKLYEETAESVDARERHTALRQLGAPINLGARPTKRDRRRFDAGQH